ncbi:hypothetical protein EV651_10279 [Kribbella sp. VKM Ac-2571]|nr:hypothetical protein EV651_10279 [Kribbella sp. VKM Ac-2571]
MTRGRGRLLARGYLVMATYCVAQYLLAGNLLPGAKHAR